MVSFKSAIFAHLIDMTLKEIVSVSGKPGLHKIIGKRSNGIIVESLDASPKRFPVVYTQKVSILEDISMFTYNGDVKLKEVLGHLHDRVKEGLTLPGKQSTAGELRTFFAAVLPEFDQERVYPSDILKLANWYQILAAHVSMDELLAPEEETGDEEEKAE